MEGCFEREEVTTDHSSYRTGSYVRIRLFGRGVRSLIIVFRSKLRKKPLKSNEKVENCGWQWVRSAGASTVTNSNPDIRV